MQICSNLNARTPSCDRPKAHQKFWYFFPLARIVGAAHGGEPGDPRLPIYGTESACSSAFRVFWGFFPQDRPNLLADAAGRSPVAFQACSKAPRRPKRPSRTLRKAPADTLPSAPCDSRAWVPLSQLVRKRRFFQDFAAQGHWKVAELASLSANKGHALPKLMHKELSLIHI